MSAFPPPLDTIDWTDLGFRWREVHGHVEATYSKTTGKWTSLRAVSDPFMRIHGMAPVINYGQQAFEGLKAFRGPGDENIFIFRPERNALRLQHSAEVASLPCVSVDMFNEACRMTVALNADFVPPHATGAALYLRPQLYGSSAQLGLSPPDEYTFCVFAVPTGVYHGSQPVAALILDNFDRAAPHGTGHAKVGGNYAPVMRWSDKARQEGFSITLHLDSAHHEEVDEFSTSGFIGVIEGQDTHKVNGQSVTLVVPDSACVIESVTSESVLEIARGFGWKTEKRPIKYEELTSFGEVMAAGTAAALVPIRSITRRNPAGHLPIGPRVSRTNGAETVSYMSTTQEEAGPVCLRLTRRLREIQQGKVPDELGWRSEVTALDQERTLHALDTESGKDSRVAQTIDQLA